MVQIKIALTLSEEEDAAVTKAYAAYLAEGGKASKNMFLKQIVMKKVKE